MRATSFGPALCALVLLCSPAGGSAADYAIGADLSFLKQAESRGTAFKDNGEVKPGLQIFKDHGYNWIRLRLFHAPAQLPNNPEYTIALAKEAKKLGFKFLLNFHYSDTWAPYFLSSEGQACFPHDSPHPRESAAAVDPLLPWNVNLQ